MLQLKEDSEKRRRTASTKLKTGLKAGMAEGERRFYVKLPISHDHHLLGEVQYYFSLYAIISLSKLIINQKCLEIRSFCGFTKLCFKTEG